MRRSFKLTTAFTGVTALAGAFGPAALAATAQPAIGSIRNVECGANNGGISKWVHLYYPIDDHPAECFGDWGSTPAKATIASLCPGDNNGILYGSVGTVPGIIAFHAGEGRHSVPYYVRVFSVGYFRISKVSISGWTGSAKCLG